MWIRLRLDIGWRDLLCGFLFCLLPKSRAACLRGAEDAWSSSTNFLVTLSVRSSFDLLLRALQLPHGSEVLLSALTVPDMVRIVELHGLVPVPVDIGDDGSIDIDSLEKNLSSRARMIVIAHLFGARMPLDDVIEVARKQKLLVVEDLAQGFSRVGDQGHPGSDIAMYSFGPIKTSTALGGAVIRIKSESLRLSMQEILDDDPVQSSFAFARRLVRFACIKLATGNRVSAVIRGSLNACGYDFDSLANTVSRGFKSEKLLEQLRRQPATPLIRLLRRRWLNFKPERIERRIVLGKLCDACLGKLTSASHTYWMYPIKSRDPEVLHKRLRKADFDSTSLARMTAVPSQEARPAPINTHFLLKHLVILPWYPDLPENIAVEMAALVKAVEGMADESET